jgi:vacuolar-type H+-ATPase subunit I/STV1
MSNKEQQYKAFFDKLYYNVYNHSKRGKDQGVLITADFLLGDTVKTMAKNQAPTIIQQLRAMASFHEPDKIMITLNMGNKMRNYQQDFTDSQQATGTNSVIQQATGTQPEQPQLFPAVTPSSAPFTGFGQVSVEDYINKRLEEDRKQRELAELHKELDQQKEANKKLTSQVEDLQQTISENEKEKAELNGIIESKKTIRYWAGLTGDIMESIGIRKEKLREPLAGLVASEQPEETKEIAQEAASIDESGIVEDKPQSSKRSELITLISDYLKTVDDPTLANIFLIFSEIEKDHSLAQAILTYLNEPKQ